MAFQSRDEEYELKRALVVLYNKPEMQALSKSARHALQQIVVLRAGAEVSLEGEMHAAEKYVRFAELLHSNKKKLMDDLQALASAAKFVLPDYVSAGINNCNAKGKTWLIAPNANAWKKYTQAVAKMRNHVLPIWNRLFGQALPSGTQFDEKFCQFVETLGIAKCPRVGSL